MCNPRAHSFASDETARSHPPPHELTPTIARRGTAYPMSARTRRPAGASDTSGRIERTQGMIFSADETAGVGQDDATPVTADYKERDNSFTGKIIKVKLDVKPIGAADKAEANAAQHETNVKRALSN